jgi:hypothetical protein
MTIFWFCKSCGYEAPSSFDAFLHRAHCENPNPLIEPVPVTGIEREARSKVIVMEAAE